MAHVADHLSVSALEQQYRSCTDVTAARHFQTIWLLAKGHDLAQVSATVSYARRWCPALGGRAPHWLEADHPPGVGPQGSAADRARSPPLQVVVRHRLRAADLGRGL